MNAPTSRLRVLFTVTAIVLLPAAASGASGDPMFYDAALCSPPYTMTSATAVYDAAEALAKPDTSSFGSAIYKVDAELGRDGFKSNEIFFASSAVGVLIEGERADELAAKYQLKPETSQLPGATKGFSRQLAAEQQPEPGLAGPGKISIVAREGSGLNGKTLLACEFVPD